MVEHERREWERVQRQALVSFREQPDGNQPGSELLSGRLADYSLAGMRFYTDRPLTKNTRLLIELDVAEFSGGRTDWLEFWQVDSEARLNLVGSVMWCQEHGGGGEFEVGTRFIDKA